MGRRAARQWRELREKLFPERQIIFRSRGDVRYVALGTGTQIALACSVLFAAGWIGYASVNTLYRDRLLDARDRRIAELASAYDELKQHNISIEQRLLVETRELEQRYEQLLAQSQASQRAADASAAGAAKGGKAQANSSANNAQAAQQQAAQQQAAQQQASAAPPQLSSQAIASAALANAPAPPLPASKPTIDKAPAKPEADAPGSIEDLEAMLRASRERPNAGNVAPKAGEIESRILALRPKPRELSDDIQPRAGNGVAQLEKILRGTGADIETLLGRHAEARAEVGVGGPLRALGGDGTQLAALGNPLGNPLGNAGTAPGSENGARSGRWADLLALAHRLPLTMPMQQGEAELSSGFGRRLDPFTKQWAFHAGLDLIGPRQAAVYSAAPGVVVFAGRKGPYGRAVEIDHGLGVKTRYAHLSAINVQLGETVPLSKRIGAMGSTGRSTGQHLHYEILLDDEPVDPAKFIEAGYHVFKQQEDTLSVRQ